jgi:peroxiredoxin Q/BCP
MASMLIVGDEVPDFSRPAADGTTFHLAEYRDRRVVVLYFYPKDATPGCTIEACGFRDYYTEFMAHGAIVVGVSADSPESHRSFIDEHDLPFTLISDEDESLRRTFGVPKSLGLLPGRATYVIDRSGVVRHMFNSQLRVRKHVDEALEMVKKLR